MYERAPYNSAPAINRELRWPQWNFSSSVDSPSGLVITTYEGQNGVSTARFMPPTGTALAVGPYEQAIYTGYAGVSPGLLFENCYPDIGRFAGAITRFAADFEALCDDDRPPYFGEIRYNSTVPTTRLKMANSTLPDAFALQGQFPVRAGAIVNLPWISLLGANAAMPISIQGAEYSINGGPYTSAAGVAQPRDMVSVRTIASKTAGGSRPVTLTAGGRSSTDDVRTYAPGTALTGLYWQNTMSGGTTRLYLQPSNRLTMTGTSTSNSVSANLSAQLGVGASVGLAAPAGMALTVGTYEGAEYT